jgi:hypothetical protein
MKAPGLLFPIALALAGGISSAQAAGDGWIVSETTSPIDYSPIATATTASRLDASGGVMQLAIRCRGGRTELALTGPSVTGRGASYSISYRVKGGEPVQVAAAVATFGEGIAFRGDAVPLLQSLPNEGELAVQIRQLSGSELDGSFSLQGLEAVRRRIGATCKWPRAIAKPKDQ